MSVRPRLRPVGERAVLVELAPEADPAVVLGAARQAWERTLEDAVGGDRTVLLRWRQAPPSRAAVEQVVEEALAGTAPVGDTAAVRIPVRYDGADLTEVARRVGVDEAALVALHTAADLRVRFVGTAGFPYLTGGDPRLHLPRRPQPRVRVPAGAVAVAAGYSGIYPRPGPGGWWLLGTTELELFDPARRPPALLAAGVRARFEALP